MSYDIVLRDGTLYDGSGDEPVQGDIVISGDMIAEIGKPGTRTGKRILDVDGLAIAPGFINMLSWSVESLIEDGHSQSEIRQGVTLEVMGEGERWVLSMRPRKRIGGADCLATRISNTTLIGQRWGNIRNSYG